MDVINMFGYMWSTIEFAAETINSVVSVVTLCFGCTVYFGKFIVEVVSRLFSNMYDVVYSVGRGITIMCEDFPYFLTDLENILHFFGSQFKFLYESVVNFVSSVFNISMNTMYLFTYTIASTKGTICDMYKNGLRTLYNCILTLKGALILIGNSIWMCLTFIPAVLLYLFSLFLFFVNRCTEEISSIFCSIMDTLYLLYSEILNFIMDTPVESICGLIVGFGIIYLMSKYKVIILRHISQGVRKISKEMRQYFKQSIIHVLHLLYMFSCSCKHILNKTKKIIVHLFSRRIINVPKHLQIPSNERLCVVCQDSETNIVIMPCNHMCLCEDCSQNEIFAPRRGSTCPVCRRDINKILKVYP